MNKKIIALSLAGILGIAIVVCIVKCSNPVIIQGEVEAKEVNIASKVAGRVEKINVKEGDSIKKDFELILIDTPEIAAKSEQSNAMLALAIAQQEKVNSGTRYEQMHIVEGSLQQALSDEELARKTYNRMKNLHKEGVVPTQKLDEAQAKYRRTTESVKNARSAYEMAKNGAQHEDRLAAVANVKRARGAQDEVNAYLKENKLFSPINGEITQVNVEEGELVAAGYPVVSIVDLSDVWVVFNLREDLLAKIRMGTEFEAKIPALGSKKIKLRVNYISAMGNFATWRATKAKGDFDMKTFEVRAVPVEKIDGLRSGMSAIVDWKNIR